MRKGCKVCHAVTQELDAEGRCGSCAAAFEAAKSKLTYGKFMVLKSRPAPVKPVEIEELPSENPDGREYTCGCCGRVFYKTGPRAVYCSEECRAEGRRKTARDCERRKKGDNGPRYCEICGERIPEDSNRMRKICGKAICAAKRQERYRLGNVERRAAENG